MNVSTTTIHHRKGVLGDFNSWDLGAITLNKILYLQLFFYIIFKVNLTTRELS